VDAAGVTLFRPDQHEPLAGEAWEEARARAAVAEIVAEAEAAVGEDFWPPHPNDDDASGPPGPTTVYLGAAGMVWALNALGSTIDLTAIAEHALERYREKPDYEEAAPSVLMGESGLLLVLELLAPVEARARSLFELVRANRDNETNELMWGSPGTMIAARVMYERTRDEAWLDEWQAGADVLIERWEEDGLWTQRLYGDVMRYVGPAHGFAGNVRVLLDGGADVAERAARTVERLALRKSGLTNWLPVDGGNPSHVRVQWCHGAPGMVASLSDLPCEELLLEGGELTWHAGPLAKGQGLCHGTAGNGYAFLKLFERTGDGLWLDRARAFAMHAVDQVGRMRSEHGRGRFTLWTGDIGVALFVTSCVTGDARVPTIDFW
jgi:Lanthionine synthetase C-like protein